MPLPNLCQPLTIQEAERRIFQEGETSFALLQEDEVITAHLASPLNTAPINNRIAQINTEEKGPHLGSSSTEGSKIFLQAV